VRTLAVALVILCSVTVVIGQKENERFETASIKRSASNDEPSTCSVVVDRVTCLNQPMLDYIALALGGPRYLIVDAPEWVTRERFDVDGKLPRGGRLQAGYTLNGPPTVRPDPPFAHLLQERIGLRAHREGRDIDVLDLVPLRDDGQFGPALCRYMASTCGFTGPSSPPALGGRHFLVSGVDWQWLPQRAGLAGILAGILRKPVIDRTGLTGPFSVEVTTVSRDPAALFTAVREQLGLVLQESHATMDVLVIDHIEPPTEN
jgi:uncharacterized protein (TIGR03435 family)